MASATVAFPSRTYCAGFRAAGGEHWLLSTHRVGLSAWWFSASSLVGSWGVCVSEFQRFPFGLPTVTALPPHAGT